MMGLVDYGSDSGSGSDDSGDESLPTGILVPNPSKGISAPVVNTAKTEKSSASSLDEGGFFGEEGDAADGEEGSKLALPAAKARQTDYGEEDEIEDIAKPKEWELKLAEKARRKLEKKAAKRAEKEKRKEEKRAKKEGKKEEGKKKRGPVRIDAFGGLSKTAVEEEKEEERPAPSAPVPSSSSSLKLFSMLPAPKTAARHSSDIKSASIMIPPSLRAKGVGGGGEKKVEKQSVVKPLVAAGDSSDEEEEGDGGDFFGLSSTEKERTAVKEAEFVVPGVPLLPSYGLADQAGPARPDESSSSSGYGYEVPDEDEEMEQTTSGGGGHMKTISNEAAQNMIFKYDFAPFGHDRRAFADADIVDVSVDNAIGPNVQENLLKNLNRHNMARASMPSLPAAAAPKDKNAKRKNQITYLANVAVAREEELQQKWAEGKAAKRMARQKYGF